MHAKLPAKQRDSTKINRDLDQPHLDQGEQTQAEARGAASHP